LAIVCFREKSSLTISLWHYWEIELKSRPCCFYWTSPNKFNSITFSGSSCGLYSLRLLRSLSHMTYLSLVMFMVFVDCFFDPRYWMSERIYKCGMLISSSLISKTSFSELIWSNMAISSQKFLPYLFLEWNLDLRGRENTSTNLLDL